MQHKFVISFVLILFLGVFVAVSQAQDEPTAQPAGIPININGLPKQMIDGVSELSPGSITPQNLLTPFGMSANEPSDTCEDAPLLIVTPGINDGVAADVSDASEESTDPVLACLLGKPSRNKGYRTVWYQLAALPYNRVFLDTFSICV